MAISIETNKKTNIPSGRVGDSFNPNNKKEQEGIFVFGNDTQKVIYNSMADYENDLADDGELNNSVKQTDIKEKYNDEIDALLDELYELEGIAGFKLWFSSDDEKEKAAELKSKINEVKAEKKEACKTEDMTLETIAENYAKESEAASKLTESAQENISGINTNASKANEATSDDKDLITKKQEKMAQLKEDMKQYEKEQKAAQEAELAKAVAKAEREYNPEKHGENKQAYIDKQIAGIIDPAKTQSTALKDEFKSLETQVKDLFAKISNRNTISRQNSFTKLNMNVQSTFTTAGTSHAEAYKEKTLNIAA